MADQEDRVADQAAINVPSRDSLATVQLPPAVNPLPPTNPVQPDLQATFAQILGKGEQALQNQRGIAQQISAVPQAPVGFKPDFVSGQGAGGFLHNILQALELAGASTTPGRAMMETAQAPALARRAQALSQLKAQEAPEQEAEKFYGSAAEGAGRLAYEQGMLGVRNTQNQIRQQQVDTQAKAQAERAANDLVRQAQGWANVDVKTQSNRIKQAFDSAILPIMQSRIDAGMDENTARIQATEDVKAALSQNQYATQHPILSMLGIPPDLGAAPGAQQPKTITPPAKPSAGSSKTQHLHFDAQGNQIK